MTKDIPTMAIEHARVAARHSIMKGIPASHAGVALMAQALMLIYDIELGRATEMVKPLLLLAHDILQYGLIDNLSASQGVTAEEAKLMIEQALAKNLERKQTIDGSESFDSGLAGPNPNGPISDPRPSAS
jgi:hypothetical protein